MSIEDTGSRLFTNGLRGLRLVVLALIFEAAPVSSGSAYAGRVEVVKSPGGVEAWLIERHETPLIDIRIAFRGGSLRDPAGRLGLANFAAFVFNEGGGTLNLRDFTARRAAIGVELGATANADAVVVEFRAITRYAREGFELLNLALNEPVLDRGEIERARRELIGQLQVKLSDPNQYVGAALLKALFPNHQLGATPEAQLSGLQAITADDIADFRRRTMTRDNIVIAVAGDIDAATLAPLLDQLTARLPATSSLLAVAPVGKAAAARSVIDAALPQSIVVFGRQEAPLTARERDAMTLIDNIINAPFTGPLFLEVREKRGLVYDVGAGIIENELVSIYSGSFGSANEKAGEALAVTLSVLDEIGREGPSEQQLGEAKDALPGITLRNLEGGRALVGRLLADQLLKLPPSRFDTFLADYQSVTLAEVRAVAKKMVKVEDMSVMVIGRPVGDITKVVPAR